MAKDGDSAKDGHIQTHATAPKAAHEPNKGAVPMHHRLKLGETDGVKDPYGTGGVSKKSTVQNSRNGW